MDSETKYQIAKIIDRAKKEDCPPTEAQIAECIKAAAAKGIEVARELILSAWPNACGWITCQKWQRLKN
jgi:hypothetical protein